jgi:hypothetical protein
MKRSVILAMNGRSGRNEMIRHLERDLNNRSYILTYEGIKSVVVMFEFI